jgi:hypothetical protein
VKATVGLLFLLGLAQAMAGVVLLWGPAWGLLVGGVTLSTLTVAIAARTDDGEEDRR